MKKLDIVNAIKEVLAEKKRPGLWANIRAKKARGEKPAHKNSNAHKDAVKAGKKINKSETKGAPAGHYFTKSGNLVKGTMSTDAKERGARKSDPKDKMRSKVPKATQYNEVRNLGKRNKMTRKEMLNVIKEVIREEATIDKYITVISGIDGKRNLDNDQIQMIFQGDVHGTFYIYTNEEGEYENEKKVTKAEALEYIEYYNARLKRDSETEERLGAKLGVLGIESELRFNHGEISGDPTVFSKNENYADGKEREIVDDILSGLNEGSLDSVLSKMKQYAKKGLLTLAMVASVAQGLQAQGVGKNQADQIQQTGIELVQQTNKINKQVEKQNLNKVKKLLGRSFDKMNQLAQQTGTILVASKGNNLSVLKSMNQMTAKSHYTGSGVMADEKDQKVFKVKDGNFIVVSFYVITMNERTNPDAFSDNENLDIKN